MDAVAPLLLGAAVALALVLGGRSDAVETAVAGVACGLALNLSRRPLRFGLAIGAIFLACSLAASSGEEVLARDRSFFGIYKVVASDHGRLHELYSGTTLHGSERIGPGPPEPLSYYGRHGPAGQALAELPRAATRRVAAVGLGAGALACLLRSGTHLTFYEIDPTDVRIARDPRFFTFLRRCPVRPAIVTGDGRRSLAREPRGSFGLVVMDAFNSDAIPVHLITRQAVELYISRLVAGGSLLFHLTNRYLDLEPVLRNIAVDLRLTCRIRRHTPTRAQELRGEEPSTWALLARHTSSLGGIRRDRRWTECADDPSARTWTDDYSNPLGVVRWG
jgi:hypothetical protein